MKQIAIIWKKMSIWKMGFKAPFLVPFVQDRIAAPPTQLPNSVKTP